MIKLNDVLYVFTDQIVFHFHFNVLAIFSHFVFSLSFSLFLFLSYTFALARSIPTISEPNFIWNSTVGYLRLCHDLLFLTDLFKFHSDSLTLDYKFLHEFYNFIIGISYS